MKLTAAKCPSCGASIKVDRNEESTICEYCNSEIIIEDAVQKYKLEISGTVKVSGIKDNEDRLNDAKNYFKLGEYDNAAATLKTIISNEPFNVDAYIWLVKTNIKQINNLYKDSNYKTDPENNQGFWDDVDYVLSNLDRLSAIDEKKKYAKALTDESEEIDKIIDNYDQMEKEIEQCERIDKLIDEITTYKFKDHITKAVKRDYRHINPIISAYFKEELGFPILKTPDNTRCIHRDLTIKYYDSTSKFQQTKITKYKSLDEIEKALKESKAGIIEKIEKKANTFKPVKAIKNLFRKKDGK